MLRPKTIFHILLIFLLFLKKITINLFSFIILERRHDGVSKLLDLVFRFILFLKNKFLLIYKSKLIKKS